MNADRPASYVSPVSWLGRVASGVVCAVATGPTLLDAARGAPTADFAVYWTAARLWADGGDPTVFRALQAVAPEPVGGPLAYPVWTVLALQPWAALPYPLAKALWAALTGVALTIGAAMWTHLAGLPGWRGALRACVATAASWWALRSTVTLGLLPGNLAAVQAGLVPCAVWLATRRPEGLGSLSLMTPFVLARGAPAVGLPAWWPRGRSGAAVRLLAGAIVAGAVAQVALGLSDPWGGVWSKLLDPLPLHVDHSLASLLQLAGLGRAVALGASVAAALVLGATVGRRVCRDRDAASIAAWLAATLLFVPRLPDYEWLVLPGLVTFALLRARSTHALPLVAALLVPEHPARLLLLAAATLWAIERSRATN